jgi:hypothetical protein
MEYSKDKIRETILECLYERAQKSKGPSGIAAGIRDLTKLVKSKIDIKQQEISVNLQILIKNGYVDEKEIQNPFTAAKFNAKPQVRYELSQNGFSVFEQGSRFDLADRYAGINIQMLNSVAVLGNQNVVKNIVRQEYRDGYLQIEELEKKVNLSSALDDEQKVSIQADLETIKSQLAKKEPNSGIIKIVLSGLSFLADISEIAPHFEKVKNWITSLF